MIEPRLHLRAGVLSPLQTAPQKDTGHIFLQSLPRGILECILRNQGNSQVVIQGHHWQSSEVGDIQPPEVSHCPLSCTLTNS